MAISFSIIIIPLKRLASIPQQQPSIGPMQIKGRTLSDKNNSTSLEVANSCRISGFLRPYPPNFLGKTINMLNSVSLGESEPSST